MKIRSVELELLRPGPPHNQLLSPLTGYIALCGDEPPETVHVPFEHYRLLRRLQSLRGKSTRELEVAITELREDVVRMLSGIRSLATSLAQAHGDGASVIELELVLSASELSLIPFEIAFYPGGPTRELAHCEVVVTRRSRRVPRGTMKWRQRPRVLMISASPAGVEPPPVQAHVDALQQALAPWLVHLDGHEDRKTVLGELKKYLVVLPNATERSIQAVIAEAQASRQEFSHIHVLAHGGELIPQNGVETRDPLRPLRFGVVLHDTADPRRPDVLSGARFFSAIAGADSECDRRLPQVVTLAMCDGATIGDVIVPGASIAHDIHDGGVPVVVASQFPLTFGGSVVLVRNEYDRLLSGDDPRCALRESRRAVHAGAGPTVGPVDWASVVQYGALPHDLDSHVREARVRALRQRIDSATSSIDPRTTPGARGSPAQAWRRVQEASYTLATFRDVEVDKYLARVRARWAFLAWSASIRFADSDTPDAPPTYSPRQYEEMDQLMELPASAHRETWPPPLFALKLLREFRDGLRKHYQETGHPVSLTECLLGNFFLSEPIPRVQAFAAASECFERMQGNADQLALRRFEVAIIYLWILDPMCKVFEEIRKDGSLDHLVEADIVEPSSQWYKKRFDRQFVDAPPGSYEHFTTLRNVRRIRRAAERGATGEQGVSARLQVAARARLIEAFLRERGVPLQFSAVIDWIEDVDGVRRTVGS